MRSFTVRAALVGMVCASSTPLLAQSPPPARAETESGYAIESEAVISACSSCHTRDASGRMSRISYLRKTPEGWQESIVRMVALNGLQIDPEKAREVVRYLADHNGIAPEELRPARWEVERSQEDFSYSKNADAARTCSHCHSVGRVMTQRRSRQEWDLLIQSHRGYYPLIDRQVFYNRAASRKGPHPVEAAVQHFAQVFPLETPEWSSWSAGLRPPRLEGTWVLSGKDPGRGLFFGRLTVSAVQGRPGEFATQTRYAYAEGGVEVSRVGRATVYTGYQWRGRSSSSASSDDVLREVMMVERGADEMSGRWYTGANDETGVTVTLRKSLGAPLVTGIYPAALQRGTTGAEVHVLGEGLPTGGPADLGPGVHVTSVEKAGPQEWVLRVSVDADAREGVRDLVVPGAAQPAVLTVYGKVDRIAILPEAGLARVGGAVFPKQFQQFEAVGFANGPDGKPHTADDVPLGRVPVSWSLAEYPVSYDDDDIRFAGAIDAKGLFTPALDGPNPERSGNRNNIGDLWVVATLTGSSGKPVRARAHLVVSVPLYMRWDPWVDVSTPAPTVEASRSSR